MLVHATRGDNLAEFRVSPGDPPDGTIVLALDLEGADPLISQKHIVYLLCDFRTGGIHCASIEIRISKIELSGPLPNLNILVRRACRNPSSIVIELNIVDEIVVLEREASQFDALFSFGLFWGFCR